MEKKTERNEQLPVLPFELSPEERDMIGSLEQKHKCEVIVGALPTVRSPRPAVADDWTTSYFRQPTVMERKYLYY